MNYLEFNLISAIALCQVEARTLEAAPVGTVALEMSVKGPRSVRAKWTTPAKPNGLLKYSVLFTGLFYADQGNLHLRLTSLIPECTVLGFKYIWAVFNVLHCFGFTSIYFFLFYFIRLF